MAYDPGDKASVEHSEDANEQADRFERLLTKLKKLVKKILKAFKKLVENVRQCWTSIIDFMSPTTAYLISRALNAIADGINKVIGYVRKMLEHSVPVVSLIYAGFDWLSRVRGPVSNISNQLMKAEHDTPDIGKWEGEASVAYEKRKQEQAKALEVISASSDAVSLYLINIARSNVSFAGKLASHLAKLAGRILVAAGEAGMVVGIPWAVQEGNDAANETIDMVGTALEGTVDAFMEAISGARDLASIKEEQDIFGNGKWPQAVVI